MTNPYPSRPSTKSRSILKGMRSESQTLESLRQLADLPDHAMAVLGVALVQTYVEKALKSRFVPLSAEDDRRMFDAGQGGFISALSNQIRLLFALGVVEHGIYNDLLLLADIRNVFSHTQDFVDFNNEMIIADCKRISVQVPMPKEKGTKALPEAKAIFHNACFIYVLMLRAISLGRTLSSTKDIQEFMEWKI